MIRVPEFLLRITKSTEDEKTFEGKNEKEDKKQKLCLYNNDLLIFLTKNCP